MEHHCFFCSYFWLFSCCWWFRLFALQRSICRSLHHKHIHICICTLIVVALDGQLLFLANHFSNHCGTFFFSLLHPLRTLARSSFLSPFHSTKFMQKAKSCSTQYSENQIPKNQNQLCHFMCRIKNNIEQCTIVVLHCILVARYYVHKLKPNRCDDIKIQFCWHSHSHLFTYQIKILMIFLSDVGSFIHISVCNSVLALLHVVLRSQKIVNWCNSIAWSHI